MKSNKECHKLNNIIEILNVKYNERDILLNKQTYDEFLDKEIEDLEKEKKDLELIISNKHDKIINKKCINGIKCWNNDCEYSHPDNWDPYMNKKECINCYKGFCNKINNKYKHRNNNENNIKDDLKSNSNDMKNDNIPNINELTLKKENDIKHNNNSKYILEFEREVEKIIEKLKINIDNIELKFQLNEILSKIYLFKNNYEDIILNN